MLNPDKKRTIYQLAFILILAASVFAFLTMYSYYTTPFSQCDNGYDSAFFLLVGQGMTKGLLPYRDFFDMKGPYLFFIEYLGQLVSYGRLGIFLVQWANLLIVCLIACKLFGRSWKKRFRKIRPNGLSFRKHMGQFRLFWKRKYIDPIFACIQTGNMRSITCRRGR